MKRLFIGLLASFAALVLIAPADAAHGTPKHWPGSGDRDLRLVDSVTPGWDDPLRDASAAWSTGSNVVDLVVEVGSTSKASRKKCAPEDGTIRVCNYAYGRTGWAGLAKYWWIDGTNHIVRAKARLNSTYVKGASVMQQVACHEIGHTLGLGHSDKTSCLYYRLGSRVSLVPNQHDFDSLVASYAHSHLTSSAANEQVTEGRDGIYKTLTIKLLAHR